MGQLISDSTVMAGDVVLNFCDPGFLFDADEASLQTARDHLVRLLAYVLYARRVFVPGRYLLNAGPFFDAVVLAPELLEQGVLIPDIRAGVPSFRDLVEVRKLDGAALARAEFLDERAKYVSVFEQTDLSALFKSRLADDLSEGGALDLLAPNRRRELEAILRALEQAPASPEGFLGVTEQHGAPDLRSTFQRWAAVRYYTTPMELDPIRVRDVPHSAARLMARADAMTPLYLEDPTIARELPDPMSEAAQRMSLAIPHFVQQSDARLLVEAALETRRQVPQAGDKFAGAIREAQAKELAGSLNQVLRDSLMAERIFPKLSAGMRAHLKDNARSTFVGLVMGMLLGRLGTAFNFLRGVHEKNAAELARLDSAPWRMSYEHLAHNLQRSGA